MGNWKILKKSTDVGGPNPPAPNIDITWLSGVGLWKLFRRPPGRMAVTSTAEILLGYKGAIIPPVGVDLSHLKKIIITKLTNYSDGEAVERELLVELNGPFTTGVAKSWRVKAADASADGVSLEFVTENEDGPTPNPFVFDMSSQVPQGIPTLSNVSASEVGGRHQDAGYGLHFTMAVLPTIINAQYPQPTTVWTTRPARRGETSPVTIWRGWFPLQAAGNLYIGDLDTPTQDDLWVPTEQDEMWTVTMALGYVMKEDAIPSDAKTSPPFLVAAPAKPPARGAKNGYLSGLIYGTGSKRGRWGWDAIYVDFPFSDPEFVTARFFVQNGKYDGSGNFVGGDSRAQHKGLRVASTDLDKDRCVRLPGTDTVAWTNPVEWDVPDYKFEDGTINPNNVFRISVEVESRNDFDGSGGAWTLQECFNATPDVSTPGGISDHIDIVMDLNVGRPLGANLATSGAGSKIPGATVPLGDNKIQLDLNGNIIVNEPALVINNMSGNLTIARISDINNIVIGNLTGNLDVSRVQNLGTFAIGNFTGNLDVSRVQNITTLSIESFSGTMSISKLRDLGSFAITNFTGNLDFTRVNNLYLLVISNFQGNLDISRVNNVYSLVVNNFQGNLDVSRVQNIYSLFINNFQGNIDVTRVQNIYGININNFTGNLEINRVNNITSINIGTLSGTLNVTYQVANGSIPIDKIATLYVSYLQGWDGATIQVGSGLYFRGSNFNSVLLDGNGFYTTVFARGQKQAAYLTQTELGLNANNWWNASIGLRADYIQASQSMTYGSESGVTTGAIGLALSGGGTIFVRFTKGGLVAVS